MSRDENISERMLSGRMKRRLAERIEYREQILRQIAHWHLKLATVKEQIAKLEEL